jgi:hypothetical protein
MRELRQLTDPTRAGVTELRALVSGRPRRDLLVIRTKMRPGSSTSSLSPVMADFQKHDGLLPEASCSTSSSLRSESAPGSGLHPGGGEVGKAGGSS